LKISIILIYIRSHLEPADQSPSSTTFLKGSWLEAMYFVDLCQENHSNKARVWQSLDEEGIIATSSADSIKSSLM